ncbi:unnamed protein product [Calicophoron daubneyi]|uniref:Actin-related protein 8 n=1 Tax=Calicophoron daubneyi TaxID=300641 RepID=A0AAV2T4T3_CALDB
MRSPLSLAESTIIIEPGSYYLRIGRASETSPKKLPHCIARLVKNPDHGGSGVFQVNTSGGIDRTTDHVTGKEETWKQVNDTVAGLFEQTKHLRDFEDQISICCEEPNDSDPNATHLFTETSKTYPDQDYLVFTEALAVANNPAYYFSWPLSNGFFRPGVNPSILLQDLEDIWLCGLEKHVGASKANLPSYRAILVIGDVYKRNEIRFLTDLLLTRLRFGRVFVHQAGVCSTYGVGLPTACVVNVGDQKTSVCCVEDGVAHPDTRVSVSVGRNDVLRLFQRLLSSAKVEQEFTTPESQIREDCRSADLEYMRTYLQNAEEASSELLSRLAAVEHSESADDEPSCWVAAPLVLGRNKKHVVTVRTHVLTVLSANLMPFFHIPSKANKQKSPFNFQQSSLHSSQPDDPFDDLYVSMTTRERRRRHAGQNAAAGDQNGPDGADPVDTERAEVEGNEGPSNTSVIPQQQEEEKRFDSLADAVWWSICQCAKLITCQAFTEIVNPSASAPAVTVPITNAAAEEMRRRLLSCILLIGGGANGVGGECLQKWLGTQLTKLAKESVVSSGSQAGKSDTPPLAEVISQPDHPDLAWFGARLLLTTESISDLWITPTEWRRFGSRALREKAPFIW